MTDAIEARTHELVALRVAATHDNDYVWRGHVVIARQLGLTADDIAGVAVGPTGFEGHDAAVLTAVDAVLADREIEEATERVLGKRDALSVLIVSDLGRLRWFVTATGDLDGRAPIDALRGGDVGNVVAAAGALGAS